MRESEVSESSMDTIEPLQFTDSEVITYRV